MKRRREKEWEAEQMSCERKVWNKNSMKAPFGQHGARCGNAACLKKVRVSAGVCVSISVYIDAILPLILHTNVFTARAEGISPR